MNMNTEEELPAVSASPVTMHTIGLRAITAAGALLHNNNNLLSKATQRKLA